jgi:hypothetical protein
MMLHKDDGSDEPCRHMEGHLNHVAGGTAGALRLWYTLAHVARCPRCRRFLQSLKEMIVKLRAAKQSEPDQETVNRILATYHAQA